MKNIYDIFKEFVAANSKSVKEGFIEKLNQYILKKFNGIDKFNDAYVDFLLNIDESPEPDKRKVKGRALKNIANWLDPLIGIKRETIIDIAFILADNKYKNGEIIANDLLQQMHYPKLHASSEIEIFYIYALRNGLDYSECLKLYKCFLSSPKTSTLPCKFDKDTSTVFYDEIVNITDKADLFSFVNMKRGNFGVASRKINEQFARIFNKMLSYKIVISSDGGKTSLIADAIMRVLINNQNTLNCITPERTHIENCLELAPRKPLLLYVSKKEALFLFDIISQNNGKATIHTSKYNNIMELKLDFYLFYASNEPLEDFVNQFSKTMKIIHKGEIMPRSDFDKYIIENTSSFFYPIKGQYRKITDRCLFSTIFDGIDNVLKSKKSLSREGLLLWLLFYYCTDSITEHYFNFDAINALICSRYSHLNEQIYFDSFVMLILNFSLNDGKILYKNEEVEKTDDLNAGNIHELRHSVIRLFEGYFDLDLAAESFIDTSNSTTSLTFKSIRRRFNIE